MNIKNLMVTNPNNAFRKMAPPLVVFCIFDAFYSLIDLIFAGAIGGYAIAAVGICTPLFFFISEFGRTLGISTNSLMSRYLGSKYNDPSSENYASNILVHGFLLCLIGSIFILIIGVIFLKPLLIAIKLDISKEVINYVTPFFVFSIIPILIQFFPETLQAEGETRIPTIFLIVGNILNLILDFFLGIICNWGVIGLSYATIISSLVPLSVFLHLYLIKKQYTPIKFSNFKANIKILKEILKVAIPNFINRSSYNISRTCLNTVLSSFGISFITFYSIFHQVKELLCSPNRGISRAITSISGHLYGANKIDELKSFYFHVLKISFILSIFIVIISYIIINLCLSQNLFPELKNYYWIFVLTLISIVIFVPCTFNSVKIFDGMGLSIYNFLISVVGNMLTVVFVFLLSGPLKIVGFMMGIVLGEISVDILFITMVLLTFKRSK